MYISHPDKFIFFHTPKVAGSSIHIFFKDHYGLVGEQRCDPIPSIHHMSAKDYLNSNPQYKNYLGLILCILPSICSNILYN